jgi:hypothetical protein
LDQNAEGEWLMKVRMSLSADDCRLLQEAIDMLLTDYQQLDEAADGDLTARHPETVAVARLDRRLSKALARLAPHTES